MVKIMKRAIKKKTEKNVLKTPQESSFKNLKRFEEDIRISLQKYLGNEKLTKLLLKHDQEEIKALSVAFTQRQVNHPYDYLENLIPYHGEPPPKAYFHKLLEIEMEQGNFQLGYLPQKKKLTVVTAQDGSPHSYQRQVFSNRPQQKKLASKKFRSQNWQDGAVAVETQFSPRTSGILQSIKKFIDQKEEKGALDTVIPFQSFNREVIEKEHLKLIRSRLNTYWPREPTSEKNAKTLIEKHISTKERIIQKKKNKSLELNKKVEKAVEIVKEDKIKYSTGDFFDYLWKKRRQMSEEYKDFEQTDQKTDQEISQEDIDLKEVQDN